MERKDWIMVLIHAAEDRHLDRVRIVKGLFLLSQESPDTLDNFYSFYAYLYGPFSDEIYSDLDELLEENLVAMDSNIAPAWSQYRLTEKGTARAKEIWESLSKPVQQKISEIVKNVLSLSFSKLLTYVYEKYPDYAKESVLNFGGVNA